MKRLFDLLAAAFGLIVSSPITVPVAILIWFQDFRSPFYVPPRVGRGGKLFKMVKFRSMVVGADKSGVDSTSKDDRRITWIGKIVRKYKLDELSQLWNVFMGQMSLVGPRPNVQREIDIYTVEERRLLSVRSGITDLASIVFADEGDILAGSPDPDLRYNQVIRPWKSRLGLLYIDKMSLWLDLRIIFWTGVTLISRDRALRGIAGLLESIGADPKLIAVARRKDPLEPYPPPGATTIVQNRSAPPK